MKTLVCFVAGKKSGDSFFIKLKKVLSFRYHIEKKEVFQNEDEQIVCLYVTDCDVADCNFPKVANWLFQRILQMKQKKYLQELGDIAKVYYLPEKKIRPPEITSFCVSVFLDQMKYEKNTMLGIIDGEVLDYKIWVKLVRRYLDQINGLMIISDRPERFVELCRDAWEQQGLVITLTKNKQELAFCDYVIDCSNQVVTKTFKFRKPCLYLMLSEQGKKRRQLCLQNKKLEIMGCKDFCKEM